MCNATHTEMLSIRIFNDHASIYKMLKDELPVKCAFCRCTIAEKKFVNTYFFRQFFTPKM